MPRLPIESILSLRPTEEELAEAAGVEVIGASRQERPIYAYSYGLGPQSVSLLAGCHADEPVGPDLLRKLVAFLSGLDASDPLLSDHRWFIVPHLNPDGAERNAPWAAATLEASDHLGRPDRAYDPVLYVRRVQRELPGDDIEFGFPRHAADSEARPENRAAAEFLSRAIPIDLHASLHGMGFSPGPWFLLEPAWIDRTGSLRDALRHRVHSMGYGLFDVDRRGEKGFWRIDPGFSTRPDSRAMSTHFERLGDPETADKFRPSSMEWARGQGGDTLTLVSEMPLFLLSDEVPSAGRPAFSPGTEARQRLLNQLQGLAAEHTHSEALRQMRTLGVVPMPIRDQMRLQLYFLSQALDCLGAHPVPPTPPTATR